MTIMIGSPDSDGGDGSLRRSLVRKGFDVRAASGHLRGVRRLLVRSAPQRLVICVALDDPALPSMAADIQHLLADVRGFGPHVRAVGLVRNHLQRLSYGCDIYVADCASLLDAVTHWLPDARESTIDYLTLAHRLEAQESQRRLMPHPHQRLTWNCRIHDGF